MNLPKASNLLPTAPQASVAVPLRSLALDEWPEDSDRLANSNPPAPKPSFTASQRSLPVLPAGEDQAECNRKGTPAERVEEAIEDRDTVSLAYLWSLAFLLLTVSSIIRNSVS